MVYQRVCLTLASCVCVNRSSGVSYMHTNEVHPLHAQDFFLRASETHIFKYIITLEVRTSTFE